MSEFTIASDLDREHVTTLHDRIFEAVEDHYKAGAVEPHARTIIAALLIDACGIMQDAPDDVRAALAEEAVHFIMHNSGADARAIFDEHRRRHAIGLAAVETQGNA